MYSRKHLNRKKKLKKKKGGWEKNTVVWWFCTQVLAVTNNMPHPLTLGDPFHLWCDCTGGRQSVCKQSQTDCIHSQTNLQRFAINCHLIIKQIANTLQSELIWNLLIDIFCCIAKYLPKRLLIRFCGFLLEESSRARFMQYCCEYTQVTFFSNFLADVWMWFSYMGWSHFAGWDVEPYRRPLRLTVSLAINRPQLIKPLSDFCLCRKISTIKRL